MSTVNGVGTMRYGWKHRPDGTAEATVWFVVAFIPLIPIRREHVRVIAPGLHRGGILEWLCIFVGAGKGFESTVEVLGPAEMPASTTLLTYFNGFVLVPFITLIGPMALLVSLVIVMNKMGMDVKEVANGYHGFAALGIIVWAALVVALILDRSAGRHHLYPNEQIDDLDTFEE